MQEAFCNTFGNTQVDTHTHVAQGLRRRMDRDDLATLLSSRHSIAPGPDGVPYAAWQAGGDLAVDILLAAYEEALAGATPPAHMRLAFLAMLLKRVLPADGDSCRRSPAATRPITLTNTWKISSCQP